MATEAARIKQLEGRCAAQENRLRAATAFFDRLKAILSGQPDKLDQDDHPLVQLAHKVFRESKQSGVDADDVDYLQQVRVAARDVVMSAIVVGLDDPSGRGPDLMTYRGNFEKLRGLLNLDGGD